MNGVPAAASGSGWNAQPGDAAALKAWAAGLLGAAGIESPVREAALLLAYAAGRPLAWAWSAGAGDPVEAPLHARFLAMARRRARRVPFAYVVGRAEFADLHLSVGPSVLVPRPETETLLEVAETLARERAGQASLGDARRGPSGVRLVDLGTGSGALALALARRLPGAEVWAMDASSRALAVARRNARASGLADRVTFARGDWWQAAAGVPEPFDGAVCNPPYLSEAEWRSAPPEVRAEPRRALVAGPTGLEAFEAVIAGAPEHLKAGGFLAFETGAGQAPAVRERMRAAGFGRVRVARDLAGVERVVAGMWMGRS